MIEGEKEIVGSPSLSIKEIQTTSQQYDNGVDDTTLRFASDSEEQNATADSEYKIPSPPSSSSLAQENIQQHHHTFSGNSKNGNDCDYHNNFNTFNQLACHTNRGENGCNTNIGKVSNKRKLSRSEDDEHDTEENDDVTCTSTATTDFNNSFASNNSVVNPNIGSNISSYSSDEYHTDSNIIKDSKLGLYSSCTSILNTNNTLDDSLNSSSDGGDDGNSVNTSFDSIANFNTEEKSTTLSESDQEKHPESIIHQPSSDETNTPKVPSSYYFIDRTSTDEKVVIPSTNSSQLHDADHTSHHHTNQSFSNPHHQASSGHSHSNQGSYHKSHDDNSRSYRSTAHSKSSSTVARDPDEGKIFVGGLSWDTTDESLKSYFSKFGRLTDSIVMKTPEGKTRGFAFVTFEDPNVVDVILSQTHYVDGKRVDPKSAIPRDAQHKCEKMFIGGLPWGTTEDDLKGYFSAFGTVLSATLMVDQESNQSRGFGFVTFQTSNDLQNALNCQPHMIKGQSVETTRALPKTKYAEVLSSSGTSNTKPHSSHKKQHLSPTSSNSKIPHSNSYSASHQQGSSYSNSSSGSSGRYTTQSQPLYSAPSSHPTTSHPLQPGQQQFYHSQMGAPQQQQQQQFPSSHHFGQMVPQPSSYPNPSYSHQQTVSSQYPSYTSQVSQRPGITPQHSSSGTVGNVSTAPHGYMMYPSSSPQQQMYSPYQSQVHLTNYSQPSQHGINQLPQGFQSFGQSGYTPQSGSNTAQMPQPNYPLTGQMGINQNTPTGAIPSSAGSQMNISSGTYYQAQRPGQPSVTSGASGGYYGVVSPASTVTTGIMGQNPSQSVNQSLQPSYYGLASSSSHASSYYSAMPSTYQRPQSTSVGSGTSQTTSSSMSGGQVLPPHQHTSPIGVQRTPMQNQPTSNGVTSQSLKPNVSSYYSG